MTGTISIPGKSNVKFDVENLQNRETEKHIQRMIVAFLTSDTFGEDALQEWDRENIGNLPRSPFAIQGRNVTNTRFNSCLKRKLERNT